MAEMMTDDDMAKMMTDDDDMAYPLVVRSHECPSPQPVPAAHLQSGERACISRWNVRLVHWGDGYTIYTLFKSSDFVPDTTDKERWQPHPVLSYFQQSNAQASAGEHPL